MHAVVIDHYGPNDVLSYRSVPEPEPLPKEILIRQRFAGVNFADVYMRRGLYQGQHTYGTRLPLVLGLEGAGIVTAVGEEVSSFSPGDRVAYCLGRGGYAEFVAVDASRAVNLPDEIEFDMAAAAMLQGSTTHYLTHTLYPISTGDTCLVHAAAGGVGQLLVQVAKMRGARVIATVGSSEKTEIVRSLGADIVIPYREMDFVAAVAEATDGFGVDIVYDSVGQDTIRGSLKCLRTRGTCVLFGASSGPVEAIVPMELAEAGSVFFTRPHLAHYRRTAEEAQRQADDIFALIHRGKLHINVDSRFPLANAAAAHGRLESRVSSGKILLEIN